MAHFSGPDPSSSCRCVLQKEALAPELLRCFGTKLLQVGQHHQSWNRQSNMGAPAVAWQLWLWFSLVVTVSPRWMWLLLSRAIHLWCSWKDLMCSPWFSWAHSTCLNLDFTLFTLCLRCSLKSLLFYCMCTIAICQVRKDLLSSFFNIF